MQNSGEHGKFRQQSTDPEDSGVRSLVLRNGESTQPLTSIPRLSRCGGKGGKIGNYHIFVFAETSSYQPKPSLSGDLLGIAPTSVATDFGRRPLHGQGPLTLRDGAGQHSDDTGRLRGFIRLDEEEARFNENPKPLHGRILFMSRAAISPLYGGLGILYASRMYVLENHTAYDANNWSHGVAMVLIAANQRDGLMVKARVSHLFGGEDVQWGCAGTFRSWTATQGRARAGNGGFVFLLGEVAAGLMVGRVLATQVARPDKASLRDSRPAWEYYLIEENSTSSGPSRRGPQARRQDRPTIAHFGSTAPMPTCTSSTRRSSRPSSSSSPPPATTPSSTAGSSRAARTLRPSAAGPPSTSAATSSPAAGPQRTCCRPRAGMLSGPISHGGVHERYFDGDDIAVGGRTMLLS